MNRQACPDRDTLEQLLLGRIAVDAVDQWEAHLLQCDSCVEAAETIRTEDDVTQALRSFDALPIIDDELQRAIQSAKQFGEATLRIDETIAEPSVALDETIVPDAGQPHEYAKEVASAVSKRRQEPNIDFLDPPRQSDELGRLGGYRVLEVLGAGGMGIVFRAEDTQLNRAVALKVIKPEIAASAEAKERFLREAQAAAAIEHDHIVTIYQVGQQRGVPFIAMQYLKGQSLQQKLAEQNKLDDLEATVIARQVAQGLAAAHKTGLIHRDIKPDNIWMDTATSRAKILDFGLARSRDAEVDLTQSGMLLGTPNYMSPEQAAGETVDHRCDLFSLGSVLYHLVSGQPPFKSDSLPATLLRVTQSNYTPLAEACPELNPQLAKFITRMLAKEIESRPQSASEVVRELERIEHSIHKLDDQVDQTPTINVIKPSPNNRRGRPQNVSSVWLFGGGAVAAIALALFAMLASGVFVRVETEQGTLVVKVSSDDFETSVKGKSITVRNTKTKVTYKIDLDEPTSSEPLQPGDYEFVVTNDAGFRTKTKRFEIQAGEEQAVEVWWERAVSTQKGKPASNATADLDTADQRVAHQVIAAGGKVNVRDQHGVSYHDIDQIAKLPDPPFQVTKIYIATTEVTDDVLSESHKLSQLRGLAAWDSGITDEALAHLTDSGARPPIQLRSLMVDRTAVTDKGLAYMVGAKIDEHFNITNTEVSDPELVAKFSNAKILSIAGSKLPLGELQFLESFNKLQVLLADAKQFNALAKSDIKIPATLEQLTVHLETDTFNPLVLQKTPGLSRLNLVQNLGYSRAENAQKNYAPEFWSALSDLPNLTILTIDDELLTDELLGNVRPLSKLNKLVLDSVQASGSAIEKVVAACPNLRALHLTHAKLNDTHVESLSRLNQLDELNIKTNQISAAGISRLRAALPDCRIEADHP